MLTFAFVRLQVVLEDRPRDALARFKLDLSSEALKGALRKISYPKGPTLEARKCSVHQGVFST